MLLLAAAPAQAADDPVAALFARLRAKVKEGQPFELLVEIKLKPGTRERFAAEAAKAEKATAAEPGNAMYKFYEDAENPDTIVVLEKWKSLDALKSHLAEPHTQALLGTIGEIKGELSVRIISPLAR